MANHLLSKSTYIRGKQCEKSLYLNKKRPFLRDKLSPLQLAKFKRGTNVGILAQELFPNGLDCQPKSPSQFPKKLIETREALLNPLVNVIYEGVFQHDDVLIIIDILVRDGDNWKAYEVKSSLSVSTTFLHDAALQYYIITENGVHLTDFSLIFMNRDYIRGETLDLHQLFVTQSVLKEVKIAVLDTVSAIQKFKAVLTLEKSPAIAIGPQCQSPYPCDFVGHCWKNVPENSYLYMESLEEQIRFEYHAQGVVSPQELSQNIFKTDAQKIQLEAFTTNKVALNKALAIKQVPHQKQLDEAIIIKLLIHQPAVPLLANTKAYDALPIAMYTKTLQSEETVFFEQSTEGLKRFLTLIMVLLSNRTLAITDDDTFILMCLQTAHRVNNTSAFTFFSTPPSLIGLRQLTQSIDFSLPTKSGDFFLSGLLTAFGKNTFKLKEEVYLVNDFLADQNENTSMHLAAELAQYAKATAFCFNKLSEMTHK